MQQCIIPISIHFFDIYYTAKSYSKSQKNILSLHTNLILKDYLKAVLLVVATKLITLHLGACRKFTCTC